MSIKDHVAVGRIVGRVAAFIALTLGGCALLLHWVTYVASLDITAMTAVALLILPAAILLIVDFPGVLAKWIDIKRRNKK